MSGPQPIFTAGGVVNNFTFQQEAGGVAGSGANSSTLYTLGTAPTLGDLVIVLCNMSGGNSAPTSGTGTWQTLLADTTLGSLGHVAIFYSTNTTSTGITANFAFSATGAVSIGVWRGGAAASPVDTQSALASGTSAAPQSAAITPAGNSELILAFLSAASAVSAVPAGYSPLTVRINGTTHVQMAYKGQTIAASEQPAWAITSAAWAALTAAIKHI